MIILVTAVHNASGIPRGLLEAFFERPVKIGKIIKSHFRCDI